MQEILSKRNVGLRLRKIRQKNGLSQEKVASILGLSRSNYSQIELGKQYPTYQVLEKLSAHYNKSYEWFLHGHNALKPNISIHADHTEVGPRDADGFNPTRKVENISLIENGSKAAYINKSGSKTFMSHLPVLSVPVPFEGTYRAFEVEGNSMKSTLQDSDIVVAELVKEYDEIVPADLYVIVTLKEVLIKRLIVYNAESNLLFYSSDAYGVGIYTLQTDELIELWRVVGKYSTKIAREVEDIGVHLNRFDATLCDLKVEFEKLKHKSELQD